MADVDHSYASRLNRKRAEIGLLQENSVDQFLDDFLNPDPKLECGQICLTSDRILSFSCSFCVKKHNGLDAFVRHILGQHLMLSTVEAQRLLKTANEQLFEGDEQPPGGNPDFQLEDIQDADDCVEPNKHGSQEPANETSWNIEIAGDASGLSTNTLSEASENMTNDITDRKFDLLEEVVASPNTENAPDSKSAHFCNEVLKDLASENFKKEVVGTEVNVKVVLKNTKQNSAPPPVFRFGSKKIFMCKYCSKVFKSEPLLKAHVHSHFPERKYSCEYCDARFKEKSNLNVHTKRHLGIKPYRCPYCEKSFASSNDCSRHVRFHTGEKPYVCEDCGLRYITANRLKSHRVCHSNDRPYNCEICGKCFKNSQRLRNHKTSHMTDRRFACSTCDARFKNRNGLIQHEKLHSATKTYLCNICPRAFAQNAGLWWHMKHEHG